MTRRAFHIAVVVLALAASNAAAQQNPFVGTWEEVPGLDREGKPRPARPAVLMFSADGFFAFSIIPPGRPKVDKPLDQMSREELIARFVGLQVRRGTYSFSGDTFTRVEIGHDTPGLEGRR